MATTDRAAFLRQLIDSEAEMDELFQSLAVEIGNLVLRSQGVDGVVPIQELSRLQVETANIVRARFVDKLGQAFSDAQVGTNEPSAPFPRIIAEGQRAMIELALERAAAILDRALPDDLRAALAARPITNAN